MKPGLHIRRFVGMTSALGPVAAWQDFQTRLLQKAGLGRSGRMLGLNTSDLKTFALARAGTSDETVFKRMFFQQDYGLVGGLEGIKWIVDCGAYVGYSALWLLQQYPSARLVAIESDPGNYGICRRNLRHYLNRAVLLNAGIWSRPIGLKVLRTGFRDQQPWSFRVAECRPDEPAEINAIGMNDVLRQQAIDQVDLLKMDIEGSELAVFSGPDLSWLKRVRNIVIELHGDECRRAFFDALKPFAYELQERGEVTACLNLRIRSS